jgi:hypothetical protein
MTGAISFRRTARRCPSWRGNTGRLCASISVVVPRSRRGLTNPGGHASRVRGKGRYRSTRARVSARLQVRKGMPAGCSTAADGSAHITSGRPYPDQRVVSPACGLPPPRSGAGSPAGPSLPSPKTTRQTPQQMPGCPTRRAAAGDGRGRAPEHQGRQQATASRQEECRRTEFASGQLRGTKMAARTLNRNPSPPWRTQ